MENALTLSAILNKAGCDYLVYDLSRRVTEIPNEQFEAVENNHQPYPFPIQQHAQLGVAFSQAGQTPWVWFLKMPLDERGLLNQAALGDFIQFVAQAMGATLDKKPTEEEREKLVNNPYTFAPTDDKKAIFHALLTENLNLPASQYFDHTQHYTAGELGWDNWQGVGLQGLADICARMGSHNNLALIKKALSNMPDTPKYALLGCLEHCELPASLAKRVNETIGELLERPEVDLFLLTAFVRALSGADKTLLSERVQLLIDSEKLAHREMLIAIAGRCWHVLDNPALLDAFLIRVAACDDATFFRQIIADLVMIPALRPQVLNMLHGNASPTLLNAVNELQNAVKAGND
ncbi:hypothetical protein CS022_15115 [Veronia nyctiphanis]|uniref:DUF3549 domain-containing protein n=1 Tax=Veronia nyctiphanis TaxID=1278244 RepID=A0A4Q0YNR4_9GAMM|nr:DUF3549 family protein [Veronia nyctiphanis]RXJ72516.1 hypothetical protein CS022_15115 [Veronia nyctiphanis]